MAKNTVKVVIARLILFKFCVSVLQADKTDKAVVSGVIGKNVTLQCSSVDTNITDNMTVAWNRTDEDQGRYVLWYRDGQSDPIPQDPRYKNRVAKPNLKNNTMSFIISNLSDSDSGEYQCWLIVGGFDFKKKLIKTIQLHSIQPETPKDRVAFSKTPGLKQWLLIAVVCLVVVLVVEDL